MSDDTNPWTTLETRCRFEDDFFAVDDNRVLNPAGREAQYGVVRFKNRGLRILPVEADGSTLLVGQYRYGAGYFSWELPAGNQEPEEDALGCARRELGEEVGRTAESWLELLEIVPSGSITTQRERSFVAWNLSGIERHLDEQEVIRVQQVPVSRAIAMTLSGEIKDAGSIVALLALHVRSQRGDLPEALREALAKGG